jgi:hypothetical protein
MNDHIKSALKAARRQLDLPANLRGTAKQLENKFDVVKWEYLQGSIWSFRKRSAF